MAAGLPVGGVRGRTPLRHAEMVQPKRPRNQGALGRETELHGDVRQRPSGIVDQLSDEIGALRIEDGREARA